MKISLSAFLTPNEIALLSGSSHAGKSTLALQYIQGCVEGREEVLGLPCTPPGSKWGYIKSDRKPSDLENLADRLHFDLSSIPLICVPTDLAISHTRVEVDAPGLLRDLCLQLKQHGCTHVAVDTFSVFIGANLNHYNQVAAKLIYLNRICDELSITLLGIHHTGKARTDFSFMRPQDAVSGSMALQGYTSTQLTLTAPEELKKDATPQTPSRLMVRSHIAKPATVWLKRDAAGLFKESTAEVAIAEAGAAGEDILSLFSNGERLTVQDIVERSKASRATVFRKLQILEEACAIYKAGRGLYERMH